MSSDQSTLISFRAHKELIERIDALLPVFAESSTLSPSGAPTRAEVLRHLLLIGLSTFEGDE